MRSRHLSPERGAYKRTADRLHGKPTSPIRIALWLLDYEQNRMRLFKGHASKSKTRNGQRWRLFWRIKRVGRDQAKKDAT